MSIKPEKFLLAPGDTSSEMYKTNEAWETFMLIWRANRQEIGEIITGFQGRQLQESFLDRTASARFTPERLEAELGEAVPTIMMATNGLRRALDKITGTHIAWNNIGVSRSSESYLEEDDGWIAGNMIGPETVLFNGFAAFLQIAYEKDQSGVYIPIADMANIRPHDEEYFDL